TAPLHREACAAPLRIMVSGVRVSTETALPARVQSLRCRLRFRAREILYRWIRPIHVSWEDPFCRFDRCQIASVASDGCVETRRVTSALDRIPLSGVGDQSYLYFRGYHVRSTPALFRYWLNRP